MQDFKANGSGLGGSKELEKSQNIEQKHARKYKTYLNTGETLLVVISLY